MDSNVLEILRRPEMGYMFREKNEANRERKGRKNYALPSEVKLLGASPSPFVLMARIALNNKSVEYEFIEERLESKSQLLLQSNPIYKKIPVLIHRDKTHSEFFIIVQYVDDVWSSASPIVPSNPYDHAVACFWAAAYIDEKWYPTMRSIRGAKGKDDKKRFIEEVRQGLALLKDVFKSSSKGMAFYGGNQIGFLDIALGSFLGWLRVTEISNGVKLLDQSNTPELVKCDERFCAHGVVKDVMPEIWKVVEFAKTLKC
ncbi:glutathione S-transferase U17-like [Glycine max]|uniref:glutathione S-transferase U17-like n=1 Tax=Glycine max TaxID=3847 RepID=UPI001B35538E|nr:glutathione S-transferase U17-like [Glycine max]